MDYYPHKGAGNATVAAVLLALSGIAVFAEAYGLIPFSNLYLIPAGYVALRSFIHTSISSAVREGYLLAAQDIATMNDFFDNEEAETSDAVQGDISVLDATSFKDRAERGVAD